LKSQDDDRLAEDTLTGSDRNLGILDAIQTPQKIDESPVVPQPVGLTGNELASTEKELGIPDSIKTPQQIETVGLETSPLPFTSPLQLFNKISATQLNPEINQPVEGVHHEWLDPTMETPTQLISNTAPSSMHSLTPVVSLSSVSAKNESNVSTATIEGESKQFQNLKPETASDQRQTHAEMVDFHTNESAGTESKYDKDKKLEVATDQRQTVAERVNSYVGESTDTHEPSEEQSNSQSAEAIRGDYHASRSEESTASLASGFSREDAKSVREYGQFQIEKCGSMSRRRAKTSCQRRVVRSTSVGVMQVKSEVFVQHHIQSVSRPVLTRQASQAADLHGSGVHRSSQHQSRHHIDGREQFGQRGNRDGQSNVSNTSSSFTTAPNAASAIEEVSQKRSQAQQRRVAEQPPALPLKHVQDDIRDEFKGKSPLDGKARAFESGHHREETGSYCDFSGLTSDALQEINKMFTGTDRTLTAKGQVVAAPTEHTEMEPGKIMAFGATSGFLRVTSSAQHSSHRMQISDHNYTPSQDDLRQADSDEMRHWPQRSEEQPLVKPDDQLQNIQAGVFAEAAAHQLGQ
jgi:hypothetical protein